MVESRWSELAHLRLVVILLIIPGFLTAFEETGGWLDARREAKLRIVVLARLNGSIVFSRRPLWHLLSQVLLQALWISLGLQHTGYISALVLFHIPVTDNRVSHSKVITLRLRPILIYLVSQVSALHELLESFLILILFRTDKLNLNLPIIHSVDLSLFLQLSFEVVRLFRAVRTLCIAQEKWRPFVNGCACLPVLRRHIFSGLLGIWANRTRPQMIELMRGSFLFFVIQ